MTQQTAPHVRARTGKEFLEGLAGDERELWLNGERITNPLEHPLLASAAQSVASGIASLLPVGWVSVKSLTLLAALFMTGLVCVLMGCGIPTTANYIIMVTVAAPTLGLLGIPPLVAHFFVFYYGVLADITPPVALAAYAAAGMAGSDPFKTGNTAFRLGLGKALVPLVFAFAPSLLLVVPNFSWAAAFIPR